jgi:uncharacterized protein
MAKTVPRGVEVDLEALDTFLLSDRAPDNCMGLSDLDGFLTGLVVGPELIPPAEWLPIIWGGDEPEFASPEERQTILGTIMARYNEIIAHLDAGIESCDPVFWEGPDGKVIVTDWASGFVNALRLRTEAWQPLAIDQETRALIIPMILLGTEVEDRPPLGVLSRSTGKIEELIINEPEIIPECLIRIRAFWRKEESKPGPKLRSCVTGKRGKPTPPRLGLSWHL